MATMNVILQESVGKLGNVADEVKVKSGYARNFLLPQKKAVLATAENRSLVAEHRAELEQQAAAELKAAHDRAATMVDVTLVVSVNAMEEGKLYGSVGADEIVQAMAEAGHIISKQEVDLPTGPFKELGDYEVNLILHPAVMVPVKLQLVAAEQE